MPGRPLVHFTPASGWINDPLSLVRHGDGYRMFAQYVPDSLDWAPECRWLQMASPDGVRWEDRGVVLEPGDGDGGVWSGSLAVGDDGVARLFYTAVDVDDVQIGRVRVARPEDDDWSVWSKGEVLVTFPVGEDLVAFRDPCVVRDGDLWRMIVGAGRTDGTALAFQWVSEDLETWDYRGPLAQRSGVDREPTDGSVWTGLVWECPQLIRVGESWVLAVAVWEPVVAYHTAYCVGRIEEDRFVGGPWRRLSFGPSYYAGAAFHADGVGSGIVYWLREMRDEAAGWAGAHSVPHVLDVIGDRVQSRPADGVRELRGEAVPLVGGLAREAGPLDIEWCPGEGDRLVVDDGLMELRATGNDIVATTPAGSWTAPLGDPCGQDSRTVRILIDAPVVEVFTAGGVLAFPVGGAVAERVPALVGVGTATAWRLES